MAAAAEDHPETLLLFEAHPSTVAIINNFDFKMQLFEYFNLHDEYSKLNTQAREITHHVQARHDFYTGGDAQTRTLTEQFSSIWLKQSIALAESIQNSMIPLRERMDFLETEIRARIYIIGNHRVDDEGIRSLFCRTKIDVQCVWVYRRLMPPNFPEIHIVLDLGNQHYHPTLIEEADGFNFQMDFDHVAL